jgi:glycosyltransferase involved in cell wall biosynthesis
MPKVSGRPELRLAVVSPFLDRRHGTELCIIEQIERFATQNGWQIDVYSQRVEGVKNLLPAGSLPRSSGGSILWHRISRLPGPHLFQFLWWFFANRFRRRSNARSGKFKADLTYSPGINCFDADVIVVHIVFHEFYARVRSELKLLHTPIRSWPLMLHRRLYYRLIMALERKIYSSPRVKLIAVSQLVAHQLQTYFKRPDAIVIPNAVDTLRFTPDLREARRSSARESYRLEETDFVCLLIGNDWKKKGLDTLLSACAKLSNLPLRLLIVGSDDSSVYQTVLAQLQLQSRVRFLSVSEDVLSFYAAADLYVGPSLEDAFGLPIVEAMACGLPVIASVRAGASELVRDGETGFLLRDPKSTDELAGLIQRLVNDRNLRHDLGRAAAQFVQQNCSWDRNASRTREFLEAAFLCLSQN